MALFYTGDFHLDLLSGHIFSEPDSFIKPMEVFTRIDDDKLRLGVCSPDGTECILEKRLQINFCPMCGRKLRKRFYAPTAEVLKELHKKIQKDRFLTMYDMIGRDAPNVEWVPGWKGEDNDMV